MILKEQEKNNQIIQQWNNIIIQKLEKLTK